jgi:hypothetical protein
MAIEFYDDLQVYHSDGSYALLRGQGLFLNRSTVYLAPLADNFSTLNIGYDGARWGNVEINAPTIKFENGANEFMRIDSSGNVGIGTTSPAEKLTVSGAANITGKFAVGSAATHASYDFYNQGTAYFNGAVTVDDTLTVSGTNITLANASNPYLYLNDTNAGAGIFQQEGNTTRIGSDSNTQVVLVQNNATAVTIDTSKNVGIGTTAPSEKLDVNGTVNLTNLKIATAQGTDGQVLTSTGSGVAWEDASGGSSPWVTDTNGITYTAGNVGIGTASQASLDLAVGGAARFNSDVRFDADVQCAGGDLIVSNSLKDVNSATGTSGQILSSEGAGGGVEWIDAGVKSSTSGEPSGSDSVINIVSLTQAEYDAGTPVATTLYIIT